MARREARNALLLVTVTTVGPHLGTLTLRAAPLSSIDDDDKIMAEHVIFYPAA